jgi:hypothetical protein
MPKQASTKPPIADAPIVLSDAESEIFSRARVAVDGLRRTTFDQWIVLGHAVVAARNIANRIGGRQTFRRVLCEQGLEWLCIRGRSTAAHLEGVMKELPKVMAWREGLSEYEKVRWSNSAYTY